MTAKFIMLIATSSGRLSLLVFVFFLFMGPLGIVNIELTNTMVLIWNGTLSMAFFLQHSGQIRRSFRIFLSKIIKPHYIDSVFTIVSSIVLVLVVVFWQSTTIVLLELGGFSRIIARIIFFSAIAGLGWGVYSLKSFDPFGRIPIKAYLNGKPSQTQAFEVYGPYRWVRHPLYFFVLILIWSCPDLTIDRLLFNGLWTVWVYIGTLLEERDLLSDFGEKYGEYQREVPMLIPWKIPMRRTSECVQKKGCQ